MKILLRLYIVLMVLCVPPLLPLILVLFLPMWILTGKSSFMFYEKYVDYIDKQAISLREKDAK